MIRRRLCEGHRVHRVSQPFGAFGADLAEPVPKRTDWIYSPTRAPFFLLVDLRSFGMLCTYTQCRFPWVYDAVSSRFDSVRGPSELTSPGKGHIIRAHLEAVCADWLFTITPQLSPFTKFTSISPLFHPRSVRGGRKNDTHAKRIAKKEFTPTTQPWSMRMALRAGLTGKTRPLALLLFCLLLISSSVNGLDGSSSTGGMGPLSLAGRLRLVPRVDLGFRAPGLPDGSSWPS